MEVDCYTLKATEVLGVPLEDMTMELRAEGKKLFFRDMFSTYSNMFLPDIISMRDKANAEVECIRGCISSGIIMDKNMDDVVDKALEYEIKWDTLNDVLELFEDKGVL